MKVNVDKTLSFLRGLQWVERSNGQAKVLGRYSILEHGASCALLYLLIKQIDCEMADANVMALLLLHDGMEKYTGDILYPAKCTSEAECEQIERNVYKEVAEDNPFLFIDEDLKEQMSAADYKLFKFIDMAEYFFRTAEELKAGNHTAEVKIGLRNAFRVCRKRALELQEGSEGIRLLMAIIVQIYVNDAGLPLDE